MHKLTQTAIFALAIASCQATTRASDRAAPKALEGADVVYATQGVIGKCPSKPEAEAGALAALLAGAIAHGVNRIGASIKSAAAAETVTSLSQRNLELSQQASVGPCLIVTRGWFYRNPNVAGSTYVSQPKSGFEDEDDRLFEKDIPQNVEQRLSTAGLWLATAPDFYFEGVFRPSRDEKSLAVSPLFAYLGAPMSSSSIRSSAERSMTVSFAFTRRGGKSPDLSKGQGATIVLGALTSGEWKKYPDVSEELSVSSNLETLECPATNDTCRTNYVQSIRSPWESGWFMLNLDAEVTPYTLQVLVSETRKESQFLKFVASAFGAAEETLSAELQKAWIPSIGQQIAVADQVKVDTAKSKYDAAKSKALTALKTCENDGGKSEDKTLAASAMLAMNAAQGEFIEVSDDPDPFRFTGPQYNAVNGAAAGDTSVEACKAAITALEAS